MSNPLVAQAQSQTTAVTGIGIAESSVDLANGVKDGSWVEFGMGALGVGMEILSMVIDPLGTLAQYGVSWLIEHVRPLKEALDWLAGDPPVIQSFADTWANVAKEVNEVAWDLSNEAANGTAGWIGAAGDAYRGHVAEQTDAIAGAATLSDGISTGVMLMGQVVAMVRETVRDLVAELVGKLISWALEEACSLGFATPLVAAQATTAITKTITKVSDTIRKLIKTIGNVSPKLRKIIDKLEEIIEKLSKLGRKASRADSTAPAHAGTHASKPSLKGDSTTPASAHTPDTATHPHGGDTPDTTSPQHGGDGLYSRVDEGERPRPWPPERRDPRFDYWEDSGELRRTERNLRLIREKYGIQIHPRARVGFRGGLRGIYGETVPVGRGARIDIGPQAFVNEEQLARTLYHENIHAGQLAGNGWTKPETVAGRHAWEEEASAAEEQWWKNHPVNRGQAN